MRPYNRHRVLTDLKSRRVRYREKTPSCRIRPPGNCTPVSSTSARLQHSQEIVWCQSRPVSRFLECFQLQPQNTCANRKKPKHPDCISSRRKSSQATLHGSVSDRLLQIGDAPIRGDDHRNLHKFFRSNSQRSSRLRVSMQEQ